MISWSCASRCGAAELPAAVAADRGAASPLTDPALLINRELSWLDFNERVLAQATGGDHPQLDRVRFLAIVATNLEEFFMIRVAALLRKSRAGLDDLSPDGLSTAELLRLVRKRAADMLKRQAACWNDVLIFGQQSNNWSRRMRT